jgi:signal transduction histidine kinase
MQKKLYTTPSILSVSHLYAPRWRSLLVILLLGLLTKTGAETASGNPKGKQKNQASQRLEILLGKARIGTYNLDNLALNYSETAYLLADSLDNQTAMAEAALLSGIAWKIRGDMAQSLVRLFQAAVLYKSLGNNKEYARTLRETGETYRASALYDHALMYLYQALEIEKSDHEPTGYAYTCGRLAATYLEVLYSLEEYKIYLDIDNRTSQEATIIIDSVANIKSAADSCLHYIRLTDSLAGEHAIQTLKVSNYVVLASYLSTIKKHEEALGILKQAEREIQLYGPGNELPLVYYNMANILYIRNKYDSAIHFATISYGLSKKLNIQVYHLLLAGLLTRIYSEKGDFKTAYYYLKEYYQLRETYYLNDIEIKRLSYIRDTELQARKREIEIQKTRQRYLLSIFILVITFLAAFLAVYYRKARQHKNLNRELSAKNQLIHGQNEQLAEMNAEKDKFFSIIAHDLRSPFGAMLGLTELMVSRDSDYTLNDMQDLAANLNQTAQSTFNLVENLLEWSRLQRGLIQPEPFMLNVQEMATDCLNAMQGEIIAKDIHIQTNIHEDISIYGDLRMVQTALRNIISNAVKFTPRGGKVSLCAIKENHQVRISISDTGVGIPGILQSRIFSFDDRKTRKGTEGEKSSGLGLTMSKEFIERNRGSIEFESEEGKGSTFTLILSAAEWS